MAYDPYEFGSARRRVEQARQLLALIENQVAAFEERRHELPPQRWEDVYPPMEPPAYPRTRSGHELREIRLHPMLSISVGELLYNLRAALDYMVFSLAWHDTGREPTNAHARGPQFPIEDKKADFDRAVQRRLIGGSPSSMSNG